MKVRELFASLGLDMNAQSFAMGNAAFAALQKAMEAAKAALAELTLVPLIRETVAAAGQIDDLAQSSGISRESLQEWAYAAELGGVSIEQLGLSLQQWGRRNPGKDLEKSMMDLADRVAGMPDGAAKVKLMMDQMGRSGARMIPVFNGGSKALKQLFEDARADGFVMSDEMVRMGDEVGDTMSKMEMAWKGFRLQLGSALLPTVLKLVTKGFGALRVALRVARRFFDGAAVAAKTLWDVLTHKVSLAVIGLTVGMWGLGAAMAFVGKQGLMAGLKAAFGWAAAAAPVLLIITLFALLFLVLEDVGVMLAGGDSLIGRLGKKWADFVADWMEPVEGEPWWIRTVKVFFGMFADLPQALDDAWEFWKEWVGHIIDLIKSAFADAWSSVKSGAADALNWIPGVEIDAGGPARKITDMTGPPSRSSGAAMRLQRFQVTQQIYAAPGMNAADVADATGRKLQEFHDARLREAAVDLEQ